MLVTVIGALVVRLRALLHVAGRSCAALLLVLAGVTGSMLGVVLSGNLIQLRDVLGADQLHVVRADRVLVSPRPTLGRGARVALTRDGERAACACWPPC